MYIYAILFLVTGVLRCIGLAHLFNIIPTLYGGARGVVVIAVGNEQGDTSSNPGRD